MTNGEFSIRVLSQKDRMYRLAKSILCDGAEAEDAIQDVLERLWIRRDSLEGCGNLDAFILTSVRNTCLDRIRRRKTRQQKGEIIAARHGTFSDNTTAIEMRDMKAVIERIISELPERQRLVIHLRDIEGCETAEVAELAGMDGATVRMTLSRARKTVREKLLKIINHGLE